MIQMYMELVLRRLDAQEHYYLSLPEITKILADVYADFITLKGGPNARKTTGELGSPS